MKICISRYFVNFFDRLDFNDDDDGFLTVKFVAPRNNDNVSLILTPLNTSLKSVNVQISANSLKMTAVY